MITSTLTNWKIMLPLVGGALIIGAVIYKTDTDTLNQHTTPVDETTAEVQAEAEKVEVEVEAATLDETVKVPVEESTEK